MNWIRRKPKINTLTESEVLLRHQLLEAIQAEMQKPEDQRDVTLIDECLETIEYLNDECHTPVYMDPPEKQKEHVRRLPRWVVVACSVVIFFFAGTGVASAFGINVWQAILHWDSRYLQIDYVPSGQTIAPLPTGTFTDDIKGEEPPIENNYMVFTSIEEAVQAAGFTPMLPSWIPEGYELDSVEVFPDSFTSSMTIRYTKGEEDYLLISVIHIWHTDGVLTSGVILLDNPKIDYYWFNGIYYTAISYEDSKNVSINWYRENEIYNIDCNSESLDVIQNIAESYTF